ncbi:hypothetical protein EYZ11_002727 [Aspergillus tanneri]|nr:hypothetical protein EYZ11_002727 [Aspergillus tanneri]
MTTPRSQRTFKPHSQMVKKSTVGYYPFLTAATLSMPSEPDATTPTPFTFREKRLPTLPNTPSSVMDEALRIIDEREQALDAENMGSHFSDFSPTEGSIASSSPCERSRFSEWSTDTELISPASMMSSLTVNNDSQSPIPDQMAVPDLLDHNATTESSDPDTPHLTMNSKSSHTSLSGDPYFDLPRPRLTVSLSPSNLDVPGLCIHDEDPVETNTKRHAAFFGEIESVEVLGLTRSPEPTAMHFPEAVKENMLSVCDEPQGPTIGEEHYRSRRATVASQSVTMQEMMDELGYLKDIIQLGTTGDI